MSITPSPSKTELLDLIRNAATQYGRCCDLYQDGFGTFHCHEDGQRTFQMLRDVQALLGVDKDGGKTTDEERADSVRRAALNHAAPDLLEALIALHTAPYKLDALAGGEEQMRASALARAAIKKATRTP